MYCTRNQTRLEMYWSMHNTIFRLDLPLCKIIHNIQCDCDNTRFSILNLCTHKHFQKMWVVSLRHLVQLFVTIVHDYVAYYYDFIPIFYPTYPLVYFLWLSLNATVMKLRFIIKSIMMYIIVEKYNGVFNTHKIIFFY